MNEAVPAACRTNVRFLILAVIVGPIERVVLRAMPEALTRPG